MLDISGSSTCIRPRLSDVKDVLMPCALMTNHCVLLDRHFPFRAQVQYLLREQPPPCDVSSGTTAMMWSYLVH